jgi:hypothetical protein
VTTIREIRQRCDDADEEVTLPVGVVRELLSIMELVRQDERGDIHSRDLYAAVRRLEEGWCFCSHPDQRCPLHQHRGERGVMLERFGKERVEDVIYRALTNEISDTAYLRRLSRKAATAVMDDLDELADAAMAAGRPTWR